MERLRRILIAATVFLTLETHAADLASLMASCAPAVHPVTLAQIVRQESGGQMFVLSDDGPEGMPWSERKKLIRSFSPATKQEATEIVKELSQAGHMVGIGLTQLSNRHLTRLGISAEQALDPCVNLKAGAQVLTEFYLSALAQYKEPQTALVAAISAYNTGDFKAGISNGYVSKVIGRGNTQVPALMVGDGRIRTASRRGAVQVAAKGAPSSGPNRSERTARLAAVEAESF